MEKSMAELYEATEELHNGFVIIRIKSGLFEGVEYTYEKISVEESEDKQKRTDTKEKKVQREERRTNTREGKRKKKKKSRRIRRVLFNCACLFAC